MPLTLSLARAQAQLDADERGSRRERPPVEGLEHRAHAGIRGRALGSLELCGEVEGDVVSPVALPLEGSTFAAIRLDDDGSNPDTLPTDFPVKCP